MVGTNGPGPWPRPFFHPLQRTDSEHPWDATIDLQHQLAIRHTAVMNHDMISCTFEQRDCYHDALFMNEYKRTNRTKGTKILRCFPHCCPKHVNRSYCGSAVYVHVRSLATTTHNNKRKRPQHYDDVDLEHRFIDDLVVFARFEEVGQTASAVNDELLASQVFSSIQTEQYPKGEWIQGHAQEDVDDSTYVYQINPGARWYYEWESAATKAQRFTKHVLRVYVFQARAPVRSSASRAPSGANVTTLRVVAIATSTEFMVVSYRRAPNDLRDENRILALLAENVARQAGAGDMAVEPSAVLASLGQKMLPYLVEQVAQEERHKEVSPRVPSKMPRGAPRTLLIEDQHVWEARHSDVMKLSKRLAVIQYFLAVMPASRFNHILTTWGESLLWAAPASPVRAEAKSESPYSPAHASDVTWAFLPPFVGQSPSNPSRARESRFDASNDELQLVLEQSVQAISSVVIHDRNQRSLKRIVDESARVLLNRGQLREMFLRWVSTLHKMIDSELRTRYSSSVNQLHEDIVAVMFRLDELRHARSQLLELLTSTSIGGWDTFVALARLAFVRRERRECKDAHGPELSPRQLSRVHMTISSDHCRLSQRFSGAWAFDSRRCALVPLNATPLLSMQQATFSVGDAIQWMREFSTVNLKVDEAVPGLMIQSRWGIYDAADEGMRLILDGKSRVFDAFPTGMSSMVLWNGLGSGDYRGEASGADSMQVEFTAWPVASMDAEAESTESTQSSAVRIKLRVHVTPGLCSDAYTPVWMMTVDGVIEYGHCRLDQDPLVTKTQEDRRRAVTAWVAVAQVKATYVPM